MTQLHQQECKLGGILGCWGQGKGTFVLLPPGYILISPLGTSPSKPRKADQRRGIGYHKIQIQTFIVIVQHVYNEID